MKKKKVSCFVIIHIPILPNFVGFHPSYAVHNRLCIYFESNDLCKMLFCSLQEEIFNFYSNPTKFCNLISLLHCGSPMQIFGSNFRLENFERSFVHEEKRKRKFKHEKFAVNCNRIIDHTMYIIIKSLISVNVLK